MDRIEMLDQDKTHARVRRQMLKQERECFEAFGGRADAYYRRGFVSAQRTRFALRVRDGLRRVLACKLLFRRRASLAHFRRLIGLRLCALIFCGRKLAPADFFRAISETHSVNTHNHTTANWWKEALRCPREPQVPSWTLRQTPQVGSLVDLRHQPIHEKDSAIPIKTTAK